MKRNFTHYILSSLLPNHTVPVNSDLQIPGVKNKDNNYMKNCHFTTGDENPAGSRSMISSATFFKSIVFVLSMLVVGIGSSWGQAPGNNCGNAVPLTLPAIGNTITTGAQTTCGRVGDFAAGFSSVSTLYGGGEDAVYSINVPAGGGNYTFTFTGMGANYKILSIHSACAPTTANTLGGFVTGSSTGGSVTLNLTAGTRFIIIDTWPAPPCGGFTLNITRNNPPNPCGTPINIASAPVTNQALSCNATAVPGALNATNVPTACGGASNNYKGGQDAIYTFTPTTTGTYTISYTGVTYSAIFVYSGACPASGGTCVGSVGSAGSAQSLALTLTAGVQYFIWFDTWPAPNSPCPGTFSISAPVSPPTISSISPTSGCPGTTITINGTNLTGATAANVLIGGTPVTAILTNTATQITATVGAGTTGIVSVTATAGSANSAQTFTVNTAPAAPTANAPTSLTSTSAIASWSASAGATQYFLDVATNATFTAFVAGFNNLNVGNVTTRSITGLTSNTTYYYRVRASNGSCSGLNSATITFLTPCASSTVTTTISVNETFNTTSTTLGCWRVQGSGLSVVATGTNPTAAPQEGNQMVQFNSYSLTSGTQGRLYSMPLNTSGATSLTVDFYWLNENNTAYVYTAEGVQVQYSTDGGATWTNTGNFFTRHDGNLAAGTSQWNLKSVDVGAVGVGTNILIGFLFTSQYGDNCFLDNVTFKQSCIAPGNPATYGSGSWIGYVYNSNTVGGFDTYRGFVTESETFNRTHTTPTGATTNHCSSNQDMFTIRYRMTKNFPAGDYIFTIGGDDGVRLSINGGATWLINQWVNQGYTTYSNTIPVSLSGNTDLVFEYYENVGGAQSSFSYALAPVPGCATYTSPANGATGVVVNPTLTWGAVANATSYDVYLGIGSLPATPTANVTGTSYSAICNGLSNYVWMVVPKNAQGAATGCATWSFTTMSVAYATAWISANTGNSWWCQGETRNVTVTIKNNGTVSWVDGGGDNYNVGIKWDTDPDFLIRVDAQNLAAGATATYTFTVTAPAAGNNNLTFDVVKEGAFWFGNNNGGAGPGNTRYTVAANVNATVPTLNAGRDTTICLGQSVTLNGSSVIRPTLNQVLAAINANQSTLLATIPTPYGFTMDMGVNSNYISDGGNDMYDGGNYINTNIAANINYSDNTVISSASFGTGGRYFTRAIGNLANSTTVPTIFYWAADLNGVTSVSVTGNNGADGSGTQNINTFTVTANGVTYNCFLKRVYAATDPSINQLFIIPQPNTITTAMGATTDDNLFSLSGLTGVDRMYYMLYAGSGGAQISVAQATTIAQTFVNTISVSSTVSWTSNPTGFTSSVISPTVTPTTTTTYTLSSIYNGCTATSDDVLVTVSPTSVAGTAAAVQSAICSGANTTINLTGSTGTIQWQQSADGTTGWANVSGGTGATTGAYTTANLTATTYYRAVVTSGVCSAANSNVITVTVYSALVAGAHNTTTLNVCDGANPTALTFTTAVSGGSGSYNYQWQNNGVDMSGEIANSYDAPALTAGNYSFRCMISDGCSTVYTTPKVINVVADPDAPTATKLPALVSVCIGTTLTISNPVYGTNSGQSCGFEYGFSTDNGTTWSTTSTTIPSFTSTGTNNRIRVRVIGGCATGCNASNWTEYTWTVNATPTASISGTNTICSGNSSTFTASGGSSYNWSTGASTSSISVSTAQTYIVTVTDANGCTATTNRALTVNATPTASISGTNTICSGNSSTFTASGGGTYNWSTGASTSSISVSTAQTYNVTVTAANGCTASTNRTLTVNTTPSAPTASATQTFCTGVSSTVADLTTTSGSGIQWYTAASGGTALSTGTALSNGTYYVSQSSSGCESSRLAVTVSTNAQPTDPAGIATNDVLWKGGAANPNDWSTASNWYVKTAGGYTVAPSAPASTTNVFVGSTGSCINTSVLNLTGLTRCKNLFIESGATLNLGGSSDVLEVYGNWDNNGTLNANTSTVKFISTNNQTFNTAGTSETFYNLYIDNNNSTNQNYLLMNKSVKVMNTFHMEGNVRMNTSTMLEIGSSSNPGEVLWHDGVVIGPMRRWFLGNSSINVQSPSLHNVTTGSAHLNPTGIFPVGVLRTLPGGAVEHEHKNASVNFKTNVATAGHLTVEFITSNAGVLNANNNITTNAQTIGGSQVNSVASTSGLNAIDFYGYWRIDASAALMTVNYDASFRALNIDLGSNPADVRVLKTSSYNTWNDGVAANNGSNTTMHTLNGANVHNDRVYSIENLLGFSGFTFGFNGATLPIQLSSFTGETDNAVNYLKWTTQSEQNSSHFEIERSVDAINFEKIGRVNAMGVSNQVKQYSFNDVNPIRGMNYYRLKLVDIDGTNSNSNTIALEIKGKETTFVFFPNPTTDVVSYQYEAETNESLNMEVVNALGQVVISQTRAARVGTNSVPLNMSELAPGAYTVRVKHMVTGITHTEQIIKK